MVWPVRTNLIEMNRFTRGKYHKNVNVSFGGDKTLNVSVSHRSKLESPYNFFLQPHNQRHDWTNNQFEPDISCQEIEPKFSWFIDSALIGYMVCTGSLLVHYGSLLVHILENVEPYFSAMTAAQETIVSVSPSACPICRY